MEFVSETKRKKLSKFKAKYRDKEIVDKGLATLNEVESKFYLILAVILKTMSHCSEFCATHTESLSTQ